MNTEDQFIKQFLESHPPEKAPKDFTQKVMSFVLTEELTPKKSVSGDWIYAMVSVVSVFTGLIVYFIFDKQGLITYFLRLKEIVIQEFVFPSWSFSLFAYADDYSIAPFWLGVLFIPILLLTIDKIVNNSKMKANIFFVG